jgi:hypothetical protein
LKNFEIIDLSTFPSDFVLDCFLDKAYTLKDVCDVVDPSLLNIELLSGLIKVYRQVVLGISYQLNEFSGELSQTILHPCTALSLVVHAVGSLLEVLILVISHHVRNNAPIIVSLEWRSSVLVKVF